MREIIYSSLCLLYRHKNNRLGQYFYAYAHKIIWSRRSEFLYDTSYINKTCAYIRSSLVWTVVLSDNDDLKLTQIQYSSNKTAEIRNRPSTSRGLVSNSHSTSNDYNNKLRPYRRQTARSSSTSSTSTTSSSSSSRSSKVTASISSSWNWHNLIRTTMFYSRKIKWNKIALFQSRKTKPYFRVPAREEERVAAKLNKAPLARKQRKRFDEYRREKKTMQDDVRNTNGQNQRPAHSNQNQIAYNSSNQPQICFVPVSFFLLHPIDFSKWKISLWSFRLYSRFPSWHIRICIQHIQYRIFIVHQWHRRW